MVTSLPVAVAQLAPALGDFAGNRQQIAAAWKKARACALLVTPALALTGGPVAALGNRLSFQRAAAEALADLRRETAGDGPALLVGTLLVDDGVARPGQVLLQHGEILARFPASPAVGFSLAGARLAVAGDIADLGALSGVDLVLVPTSEPFRGNGGGQRLSALASAARRAGAAILWVNRTGGEGEDVFAGGSMLVDRTGNLVARLPRWREDIACFAAAPPPVAAGEGDEEALWHAMLTGLRSYVARGRFPGVVLGLSGGIDSALAATLAVDALGAERVWGVRLPSRYTSHASMDDAAALAASLGIRLDTVGIEPAVTSFAAMLAPLFAGRPPGLAEENWQARARMIVLMALSNQFGPLLLSTGNRSEIAVGYSTLYGDAAGGYNVLKDLYKTEVFRLAGWRNRQRPALALGPEGAVIPESILTKPPSAELHEGQRDDDSLPPYEVLDPILRAFVDEGQPLSAILARGLGDGETVARVERLLRRAQFKRVQGCPGVRLKQRGFAGWPLAAAFLEGAPPRKPA